MKKSAKYFSRMIVFVLTGVLLAACSDDTEYRTNAQQTAVKTTSDSSSERLLNPDWPTYVVGIRPNFAPFTMLDEDGKAIGFDVDLLNAIGQIQKVNMVYVPSQWSDVFKQLSNGGRDIVASGAYITEERNSQWAATDPTIETMNGFLTDGDTSIDSLYELRNKSVGVINNTAQEVLLTDTYKNIIGKIEPEKTAYLGVRDMLLNNTDAVYSDLAVLSYFKENLPKEQLSGKLRIIKSALEVEGAYAFYVRQDDAELLNLLNLGLNKIRQSGQYDKIRQKWLGDYNL